MKKHHEKFKNFASFIPTHTLWSKILYSTCKTDIVYVVWSRFCTCHRKINIFKLFSTFFIIQHHRHRLSAIVASSECNQNDESDDDNKKLCMCCFCSCEKLTDCFEQREKKSKKMINCIVHQILMI